MKLAIFGFEQAGKSTVFNALTGGDTGEEEKREKRVRVVPVPDPRLERLREDYKPKKFSPASVQYEDFPGFGGDKYFGELRDADALVGVVRGFRNDSVMARNNKVDWQRDLIDLEQELAIADYVLAEKNVDRLTRSTRHAKASKADKQKLEVLQKLMPLLEEGRPAYELDLNDDELDAIRDYHLLSLKPRIMIVNIGDDDDPATLGLPEIPEFTGEDRPKSITVAIRGGLEAEVAALDPEERDGFLEDFGIEEVVANRLQRLSYAYLNLISFFTAGEKEVRAWTIHRGDNAVEAAGKIHSDIARAFIRAEVTPWDGYAELGSVKACKDAKQWRLEGKGYLVQDGDIIEIRHNA